MVIRILSAAALLGLAACAQPQQDAALDWVDLDEQTHRAQIVDQLLVAETGSIKALGDGRLLGAFDGNRLTGTWAWVDGKVCAEWIIGGRSGQRCTTPQLAGDVYRALRDGGGGISYTLGWTEVTSRDQYVEMVAGRLIKGDGWTSMDLADGSSSGTTEDGKAITGAWEWRAGEACGASFVDGEQVFEGCWRAAVKGDQIFISRANGRSNTYALE